MSASAPPRVLQDFDARGHGNRLLLYEIDGAPALLKVYRARGAAWRELSKYFSYRFLDRKLGISARGRCALERAQLGLWRRHGFDVPALLAHPLPPGFDADTASWLEYCPGPTLHAVAVDASLPLREREVAVARFGAVLAERQERAIERSELGLVMKHASLKHVLVYAGRLVHFDLESAHSNVDVRDALADELSGLVRSLLRAPADAEPERLGAALLAGHARANLLREIAARGLAGTLRRRVRRAADEWRRPGHAKHDALRWVHERAG